MGRKAGQSVMSTYAHSKRVTSIPVPPSPNWRTLVHGVLQAADAAAREQRGQLLVDELTRALRLVPCRLVVSTRPQLHRIAAGRLTSKTYGYYRCDFSPHGTVRNATIRVYNLTAIRQQDLSPRVFLETVLHEWIHHYDFAALCLPRSPHTSGFFDRLRSLARGLGAEFVLPPQSRSAPGAERMPRPDGLATGTPTASDHPTPPPPAIVAAIRAILGRPR